MFLWDDGMKPKEWEGWGREVRKDEDGWAGEWGGGAWEVKDVWVGGGRYTGVEEYQGVI